jgi:protoporphyrinogen oxidase
MGTDHDCIIIGGGPAGLTTAYELSKLGKRSVVFESDDVVGGLSRTAEYKGYHFDVGGHRFFTKVAYVQQLWEEILAEDFLSRPRQSRIYYRGTLFDYPLKPLNALKGLGLFEAVRVGLSYLRVLIFPSREEKTFDQWVTNRFGKRLYEIFFKTYTEKVWGMPCSEISSEWAAQRIKNLNLGAAVRNALLGSRFKKKEVITTLTETFFYPRLGPGQMWTSCTAALEEFGTEVKLEMPVTGLKIEGGRVCSAIVGKDGASETVHGKQFFSSMPIKTLLHIFDPPPAPEVMAAADRLRYRDFLTVALIIDSADLFPDNWVYIHEADVKVGRVQNYKNWSPDMVPDQSKTALGLEYFVQEGDELWNASDEELIALGTKEIDQLGLASAGAVLDGTVLRMPKAYPVYDEHHKQALQTIRTWLGGLSNLQLIGRNGQHRYNNQDHSMMTGVFAARNSQGASHDIWDVNVEQDYHEERSATGDRLVPARIAERSLAAQIREGFAIYDPMALGVAVGTVGGLGLLLATCILLLPSGSGPVGPNLSRLGSYLFGYTVTWQGAVIGLLETGAGGFVLGWVIAKGINTLIDRERRLLLARIERTRIPGMLDGEVQ